MVENGWLRKEFDAASKRVDELPEWKKAVEDKRSLFEKDASLKGRVVSRDDSKKCD